MIGSALGLIVAGLVVLAISLASTGHTVRNGCVDVTAAAATGGTELSRCGAEARALCSSLTEPARNSTAVLRALVGDCRRARLSVP